MDESFKKQSERSKSEKLRLFKTKLEYTKLVKEQFKPKIDENKKKEILMRLEPKSTSKEKKKQENFLADSLLQKIEEGEENAEKFISGNLENEMPKAKKVGFYFDFIKIFFFIAKSSIAMEKK